jgi:hypothetical protein
VILTPCQLRHSLRGWILTSILCFTLLHGVARANDFSPDQIWSSVAEASIARNAQARAIIPDRYRTVQLDARALQALLQSIPLEASVSVSQSAATLWLPLPDGKFGEFRIVESPIMEPGLAARYPDIRTWIGQGIDDPSATARLDLTPKGCSSS